MSTTKTIKSRIQVKSDTSANWDTASKKGFIPLEGEFIYYTDTKELKVGNGVSTPNQLPSYSLQKDVVLKNNAGDIIFPNGAYLTQEKASGSLYIQSYRDEMGDDSSYVSFDRNGVTFGADTGSNMDGQETTVKAGLEGFKVEVGDFNQSLNPLHTLTLTTENGLLYDGNALLTEADAIKAKINEAGVRAIPIFNNGESQIYTYKKYDSDNSTDTLVERNSSGYFNIEKATSSKHPVRYDQAKEEFAAKNATPQTVYITDPQGEQSHKKYTSEAAPASIVHREQSLNTFMVADPLYNGHPVTARYAKEKFFPIQNTDQTKYIRNISTYNEDESPLTNAQIDACIAEQCELGQKIYSPAVVSYHPLNQQTVATIVADENGNKIVNSYITVETEAGSVIVPRSPYLYMSGDEWAFRTPDGMWYQVDRHHVDMPDADQTVIPPTAIPYNNKEFFLQVCDLADSFEHVASAVMIQDPSGNPSYKNYTTGVADQANYIDYNYNLTDVDKYNRIEREKVGGQIVSFNSQGFFNVPNPENACHPVNLGYAQANFLRLKTKKENGEVASVYTDSIPYIKVQDQDYGISLNNAVFEPLKLTYGPSNNSDTSQSGRVLRYYSNGRFNVLNPTASLHPVNKQYLESQLSSYVKKDADGYTLTTGYNNTDGDDRVWLTLNNNGFKVEAENSSTDYNQTYIQLNRTGINLYSDYHAGDLGNSITRSSLSLKETGVSVVGETFKFNGANVATEADIIDINNTLNNLNNAMHFIGVYSVTPTKAFVGSDKERDLEAGDVYVNDQTKSEYVYDGFIWVELGSEGSYVLKSKYDEDIEKYDKRIGALEAAVAALQAAQPTILNIVDNDDVLEIQ